MPGKFIEVHHDAEVLAGDGERGLAGVVVSATSWRVIDAVHQDVGHAR